MSFNLDNYVDVPTRLKLLFERYPDASVVADPPCIRDISGHQFIEVTVTIHCNDEHNRMARASAWESFPGKTPYTKDSEMMNAETSATGRACGLLGIGLKSSVASLDEVRARRQTQSQELHPANQNDETVEENDVPKMSGTIVNKFAKPCNKCRVMVAPGEGIAMKAAGTWVTMHKPGECPQ